MLNAKISAINSRQNELKAKLLMAETREKVNALTNVDYGRGLDDVMTALEEQANARLNNAQAIKELGENAESSIVEKVRRKCSGKSNIYRLHLYGIHRRIVNLT